MASVASELESMKRRLEELEKENAKLKGQKVLRKEDIQAIVGEWKGHPVMKFEGPFKPFSLGLKKCWIVLQKVDEMRAFVDRNKDKLATASDTI